VYISTLGPPSLLYSGYARLFSKGKLVKLEAHHSCPYSGMVFNACSFTYMIPWYMLQHELGMILYPVFVHMYLELVYNGHEEQAIQLMERFGHDHEKYYQADLKRLSHVTKKDHMKGNELTDTFK
jgi:hypothetical protein